MKILVLTSTFPRWENDTDPPFAYELAKRLSSDHDIHVLAPHCIGAKRFEILDGINVHRFRYCLPRLETLAYAPGMLPTIKRNPFNLLLVPLFLIAQLVAAVGLIRAHRYDLIHAHWIVPQGIIGALARKLVKEKFALVVTSHGGDLYSLNARPLRALKRWVIDRADHLTVVSNAMRTSAIELGTDPAMLSVKSMGVDLTRRFVPPAADAQRSGIIYAGRLVDKKGVEYLVRALPSVLEQHPGTTLTVVGMGPLKPRLESLAEDLGVAPHVTFTGAVHNSKIPLMLQRAAIAVFPSVVAAGGDQEGLGLTIVEAMGCGCATIASDLPAIRDVITNRENGLLVAPEDPEAIADAIKMLLNDKTLAAQMGAAGRASVRQKFDWEKVGNDYAGLFTSLTET